MNRVNEVLFLGVILDEHLSWKSQIQNVARKVSKSVGMIYKSSICLNKTSLCTLYYSLVYSYLHYCAVQGGMETELESLKASIKLTVQNKEEKEHGVQFLNDEYDDLEFVSCVKSKTS